MTKFYNANDGVFGRSGGPFLDELQGPQGIQYVTEKELIERHARNTGVVVTPEEITAPVAFELKNESVPEIVPEVIPEDKPVKKTKATKASEANLTTEVAPADVIPDLDI